MSAFTSLFGSAELDKNVDNVLKSSTGPVSRQDLKARTVIEIPQKDESESSEASEDEEVSSNESESAGENTDESAGESDQGDKKKQANRKSKADENEDLESEYYSKILNDDKSEKKDKKEKKEDKHNADDVSLDSDLDESDVTKTEPGKDGESIKSKKESKAKFVDLKEEELNKAERTVFVGNVSNNVITSKTTYKLFKKLFTSIGKVQSIRFRSIAFDEAVPRKVAFVKRSLHNTRDTVNAYVVFKEKEPSKKAPARLNATVFDHHHIRVDHVAHPAPKDNKRTIFVGNLDFEETEETLWRYFNSKVDDDVEAVRIVRDSKTNLGKGFALVQFKDTLSVNKALMLNDKPMESVSGKDEDKKKKKPRKLRILRAKANAKPSILSPNHIDNTRKAKSPKARMTDDQKTKLGRAKALLGKADRNTAGKLVVEGARATKGQKIAGIKGLKSAKGKVKKPRITDRSLRFKKDRAELSKLAKK